MIFQIEDQIKNLPGRDSKRTVERSSCFGDLDDWLADTASPIGCLVAPGGRGKTTAVKDWLTRSMAERPKASRNLPRRRLFVHSFYGQSGQDQSVVDISLDEIFSGSPAETSIFRRPA